MRKSGKCEKKKQQVHETTIWKNQDAWGWCTGMTQRDGMGRAVEGDSGLGTCVHPWRIHIDVWQNQYSIVKLKNKIKSGHLSKGKQQQQQKRNVL